MAEDIKDIHKKLVDECKKGSRKAQQEIYKLYCKAMFNTCCRIMNSREEAEDMLQEAFVDAFTKIEMFRNDSTFGAWLKQIVVNKCINEVKRKKPDIHFFDDISNLNYLDDSKDKYEREYEQLTVNRIKSAVELLPTGGKMVFNLYMFEGLSHQEIAESMNISESTSKTQFMRAKIRIREILNSN
ncbi:MAG: sigma-70 family RNA polymerase sigma factor [Bacteroidota bacterium]